jgi:hypothetical protein
MIYDRIILNDEFGGMTAEVDVTYYKVPILTFTGETEENQEHF